MELITRDQLQRELSDNTDLRLVNVLSSWAFTAAHIPGSLHVHGLREALDILDRSDDIVVYCANDTCPASIHAYRQLRAHGYQRVRRYAGGLTDWRDAGLPLEGSQH